MHKFHIVAGPHHDNVKNLAAHFIACDYMEGNGIFMWAWKTMREKQWMLQILSLIHEVNDAFEKILQINEDLKFLSSKIFIIWDRFHHSKAWLSIINRDYIHDHTWYYVVESTILDMKGDIATMLAALHKVNS